MRRKLLSAFIASMLFAPSMSHAQSSGTTKLISNKVEISKGQQYHMFFKEYSEKVREYLSNNKRIAVEFEPLTADLLEDGGAWFRGKKTGEGKMLVKIYQEHPSMKDQPNYNEKLEEVTFDVVVKDAASYTFLPLVTDWGKTRTEIGEKMTEDLEYTHFTSTYAEMHPTITETELSMCEIYYTGNYEFPLYFAFFNEDNQLISSDFIVNNFFRINDPENSPISKYLQENGYEYLGYDEQRWFVMYNEKTKTQASCGLMIIQGQYFMYCMFQYSPESPLGLDGTKADMPTMDVKYEGNTIEIIANGQEKSDVAIYTLNGQCLAKGTLKAGVNRFEMAKRMPVIIKAGKCIPVKLMP